MHINEDALDQYARQALRIARIPVKDSNPMKQILIYHLGLTIRKDLGIVDRKHQDRFLDLLVTTFLDLLLENSKQEEDLQYQYITRYHKDLKDIYDACKNREELENVLRTHL